MEGIACRRMNCFLREGGFVTGEELGRRFGVSRAAVSKAMAALKREGFPITSLPNPGPPPKGRKEDHNGTPRPAHPPPPPRFSGG